MNTMVSITPSPESGIGRAEFSLYIPSTLAIPQALVVMTPGSNGDGRGWVRNQLWKDFAATHRLGLIGCYFTDTDPSSIEGYCRAGMGSGALLFDAITEFGTETGIPLDHLPLLLFGHSAGGQFNYEMNQAFPERVSAFIVNKGGIYYTALQSVRARKNPGLFFIGEKDEQWRKNVVIGLVSVNRRGGASWGVHVDDCGHGMGQSEEISRAFFASVLAAGVDTSGHGDRADAAETKVGGRA